MHVLGTPPAFNLSQDQTLHLKISIIELNGSKKTHCWTFLVTRSTAPKASTRVPTQITCKLLKSIPGRCGSGGAHCCALRTSTLRVFRIPSEGGRIIAMSCNPSTFTLSVTFSPFRAAAQAARGAQYSPDSGLVNELSFLFLRAFPGLFSKPFFGTPRHVPGCGSLAPHTLCGSDATSP